MTDLRTFSAPALSSLHSLLQKGWCAMQTHDHNDDNSFQADA